MAEKNFEKFGCKECSHVTESKGMYGCAYFGLNEDEINGKYQDESRQGKDRVITNEELRKVHGVHIPREGTRIDSTVKHLKDYVFNERCTGFSE